MNGDSSHLIAEIKTAIEKGTLTHSEMERRLEAAIAVEIAKTDSPADMERVRACQSLLWELDTHGKEAFVDDTELSLAAFKAKQMKRINAKEKAHRFAVRTIAVAAAILLVVFGIDTLFRREGLKGGQSPDEQQYIVDGYAFDPGFVDEGKADNNPTQSQTITTTSLDEAVAVLGYTPLMPVWIPEGWHVESFYVRKASIITFSIRYQGGQEELLRFSSVTYPDVERATHEFEQAKSGMEIMSNGWSVYTSINVDRTVVVWQDGLTCYSITGPITMDEMLKIINSIQRRD